MDTKWNEKIKKNFNTHTNFYSVHEYEAEKKNYYEILMKHVLLLVHDMSNIILSYFFVCAHFSFSLFCVHSKNIFLFVFCGHKLQLLWPSFDLFLESHFFVFCCCSFHKQINFHFHDREIFLFEEICLQVLWLNQLRGNAVNWENVLLVLNCNIVALQMQKCWFVLGG